jgi:hypothetical protein
MDALNNIHLDRLIVPNIRQTDDSQRTIIVYYNNKKKVIKSTIFPKKTYNLLNILEEICEKSRLYKSKEKFEIENLKE